MKNKFEFTRKVEEVFTEPFIVGKDAHVDITDRGHLIYTHKLCGEGLLSVGDVLTKITYFEGVEESGKIVKGIMITN